LARFVKKRPVKALKKGDNAVFDHIRLFRRLMTTAFLLAATGSVAAERNWTVQGADLRVTTACAKSVSIEPSSSLKGQITVEARADHQEEIDNLNVSGGSTAVIGRNHESCWMPGPNMQIGSVHIGVSEPETLELTVKVPQGIAIAVKEGGSAEYRIGDVGGPLRLELHGSGSVEAESAKELNLAISGSGDAHIVSLTGKLDGKISGSGSLQVQKAVLSSTDLTINGSGDAQIDEGDLGNLTLTLHGSGDFSGPAAGNVKYESSGSATLKLRSVKAATASLKVSGNGDVAIEGGSIGSLVISSTGSADLKVYADVTDGDVTVRGSGDVKLHKVSGNLARSERGSGHISVDGK
jgi:hypothetical protein